MQVFIPCLSFIYTLAKWRKNVFHLSLYSKISVKIICVLLDSNLVFRRSDDYSSQNGYLINFIWLSIFDVLWKIKILLFISMSLSLTVCCRVIYYWKFINLSWRTIFYRIVVRIVSVWVCLCKCAELSWAISKK